MDNTKIIVKILFGGTRAASFANTIIHVDQVVQVWLLILFIAEFQIFPNLLRRSLHAKRDEKAKQEEDGIVYGNFRDFLM
jgi:hypothetical protein